MNTSRKRKIETAQELLKQKHTNVLQCLTAAELDKLKQHRFKAEDYLQTHFATVTTSNEADCKAVSEIAAKLDKYAKQHNLTEHTIIHLSNSHT